MGNGSKIIADYVAKLSPEQQVEFKERTARMIREGLPRRDGFAHYVMYTDEHGETVTICLYIGIARKDNVAAAIAHIRNDLDLFATYPPESEWQLEPDEATQERCIEEWKRANPDKVCQFGVMGFISA
jgi:hypothetical protein